MADNLREVIAKRLANSQTSPTSTPTPTAPKVDAPVPVTPAIVQTTPTQAPTPIVEDDDDDEEFADEEGLNDDVAPVTETPVADEEKTQQEMQDQAQRVMMLQDNGIFRAELLSQLNEIRKALSILASIGIDLTKTYEQK